jgi:hypothetical protein
LRTRNGILYSLWKVGLVIAKLAKCPSKTPGNASACGAEVPDLPMTVFRHQLSHIDRRPLARSQPDQQDADGETDDAPYIR